MKKIFTLVFSCLILFGCGSKESEPKETVNEFTRSSVINYTDSSNIQYNIAWNRVGHSGYNSQVDICIVTLSKDGESHDYIVANNYIGCTGDLVIEHWPGCKCFKNK